MHGAIVPVLIAIATVTALTGIADSHAQIFYISIPGVKVNETSAELSFINRWADDLVEARLVEIYNPDTIVDSLGPIGKDVWGTLTISDPQPATFYLMEVRLENGSWDGRDSRAWIYYHPSHEVIPYNMDVKIIKDPHNTGRADQIAVQFSNSRLETLYYDVNSPSGRELQNPRGDIDLADGQIQNQSTITLTEEGAHTIRIYTYFVPSPIPDYTLEYVHPNDEPTGAHIISPSADGPLGYFKNLPPEAAGFQVAVEPSGTVTVDLADAGHISDVEQPAGTLTVSLDATAAQGTAEIRDGVFTYTANDDAAGAEMLPYTVTDRDGIADSGVITVTILQPLQAPDIDVEAVPGVLTSVRPDIDEGSTIESATGATMGTITEGFLSLGTIAYNANAGESGIDTVTYTVSNDGQTAQGTIYFYINEEDNERPTFEAIPGMQTDGTATFTAEATDGDDEQLTHLIRNAPEDATIDGTMGQFSWNATGSEPGDYIFDIVVHDDSGGLALQKMAITVSDPANRSPTAPVVHRSAMPGAPILVTPDVRDPEGQPTSMILAVGAEGGTVREGFLEANIIAYVPDQAGTDIISYTTSDGAGGATTSTVYIHTGTSADPDLDAIGVQRAETSEALTFTASAEDDDSTDISYIMSGAPAGAMLDESTGQFSWTPAATDAGDHTFTITAYDGQGGFDTEPVAVSVSEPGITNNDPNIVDFDAAARQNNPRFIALQTSDPDGDDTRIILATNTTTGTVRQDSLQFGIITYVPQIDWTGTDTVTYVVSDGRGGASTGTIQIHVRDPANGEPVLDPVGNRQVSVPDTLAFNASASDNEGDPLTYAIRNAPAGATMTPNGTFGWTPVASDAGDHAFTVVVHDTGGGFATEDIIVTVTDPALPNQNPTAPDGSTTTLGERAIVFVDISDPDGDDVTIIAATGAIQGLVDPELLKDAIIAYTPFEGAFGTETITYTVSDGRGGLATGTITITIS